MARNANNVLPHVNRAKTNGESSSRSSKTLIIGSTHAQTSWASRADHTSQAIRLMKAAIAKISSDPDDSYRYRHDNHRDNDDIAVVVGGDTWHHACSWLGMSAVSSVRGV